MARLWLTSSIEYNTLHSLTPYHALVEVATRNRGSKLAMTVIKRCASTRQRKVQLIPRTLHVRWQWRSDGDEPEMITASTSHQ